MSAGDLVFDLAAQAAISKGAEEYSRFMADWQSMWAQHGIRVGESNAHKMSNTELAKFLSDYNAWRRGNEGTKMPPVLDIGQVIDEVVLRLKQIKEGE